MNSRRRQLPVSILAACVLLPVLAGCGGSADPLHAVRRAATNTLGLTAQATLTLTGSQLFGKTPEIVGRGEFSFPSGLGYGALQLPAQGQRAAGTAYLVFLPTTLWIRPVSRAGLPEGDLWLSAKLTNSRSAGTAAAREAPANPATRTEELSARGIAFGDCAEPLHALVSSRLGCDAIRGAIDLASLCLRHT